jgi:hypothetical protein
MNIKRSSVSFIEEKLNQRRIKVTIKSEKKIKKRNTNFPIKYLIKLELKINKRIILIKQKISYK